jgi:hypothetical protein
MKKNLCDICFSGFKTEEELEHHKNRNSLIDSDYHNVVMKKDKKYFIFYNLDRFSRKHDKLYSAETIRKDCFSGNILGNVVKKSRTAFPSQKIEENFWELSEDECLKLSEYLKKINYGKD